MAFQLPDIGSTRNGAKKSFMQEIDIVDADRHHLHQLKDDLHNLVLSDDESINYSEEDAMNDNVPTRRKSDKKKKNEGGLTRQQTKEFNLLIEQSKQLIDEIHALETPGDGGASSSFHGFYEVGEVAETDEIMVKFDAEFQHFYDRKNSLMKNI